MHATANVLLATLVLTGGICDPGGTSPPRPYSVQVEPALLPLCTAVGDGDQVVEDARVIGDDLVVDVTFSGGCAAHEFALCWDGGWSMFPPREVDLYLVHDDGGDSCEALQVEELVFDLTPLAEETLYEFPDEEGVYIDLDAESVWYAF